VDVLKFVALVGTIWLLALPAVGRSLDVLSDFHGIAYTEVGRPVGLPLGGIGAGCFEITSQGTLAEFANVNNWTARIPAIPGTGLWLTYTVDGKTQAYPLAGGKVRFEGNYPFAKLTFPDLPVDLTLWCWSPLVLHDVRHSAYPIAIFDATLRNRGTQPIEAGLVLAYGTDYSDWLRRIATSHADMANDAGFHDWEVLRDQAKPDLKIDISSSSKAFSGEFASGISFSTKAQVDQSAYDGVKTERVGLEKAYLSNYSFTPIDISAACNRSYINGPFGFQPFHINRNFAGLEGGTREVYNMPFTIIDDKASAGKSVVMVGPGASPATISMPIGQKADCLFFLGQSCGWAADGSASYVIHYADGSEQVVPLRVGLEINEYWGGSVRYSPDALRGKSADGSDWLIRVFAVPVDQPDKEIKSVELSKTGNLSPLLFAVTAGKLTDSSLEAGVLATRHADIDRMAGNPNALKLASCTDAQYTICARKQAGASTLTYAVPDAGSLKSAIEGTAPSATAPAVYAVEQRVKLKPGKSAEVGLVCSWYAPNHRDLQGHVFGHKYEDWFAGSAEVANEVARDHDKLLRQTKQHYDIIATSTLPKWYREMLQSNFYQGPSVTWLTKDGISFTYESADRCPAMGTMDVRYYGSFQKLAGFPELDAMEMREFAGSQFGDGFVPHDLGVGRGLADVYVFPKNAPPVAPKTDVHAYDGYWVNLPIKFCLEVARDYQWTGDKAFLKEMWPHVKRAVAWVQARDSDNDGLPETYYSYDGWTMAGKSGYDANQWVAMLVAVARLADDLGEPTYASQLRATHGKALAQVSKLIWNGRYFRQGVLDGGANNEMVSSLQVAGDWYGTMLGFETGIPAKQVRSALETVDSVCGKDSLYGVTVCLYPDGTNNGAWQCYVCGTGWSLFYASHCMYVGLDEIGLRIADEIWRQYMVEKARVPWRQEEAIEDPHTGSVTDRLLRDYRLGVAMTLAYSAAGLNLDLPTGTAKVRPADWVWKDSRIVLPIITPRWMGQVKYSRAPGEEVYTITNMDGVSGFPFSELKSRNTSPLSLKSLRLRTSLTGKTSVSIAGKKRTAVVGADSTVDVGPVALGRETTIRLAPSR